MKTPFVLLVLAMAALVPTAAAHDETQNGSYCDPGDVSLGCYTCTSMESYTDPSGTYHNHCTSEPRICTVQVVLCFYLSDLLTLDIRDVQAAVEQLIGPWPL